MQLTISQYFWVCLILREILGHYDVILDPDVAMNILQSSRSGYISNVVQFFPLKKMEKHRILGAKYPLAKAVELTIVATIDLSN